MRNIGKILMFGGLLLIAAAFFLTAWNLREEKRAAESVESVMEQLAKKSPDIFAVGEDASWPVNREMENGRPARSEDQTAPGQMVIPDYQLNPGMEMPKLEIDGNLYIGVLEIPSLGLSLPVMGDWTEEKLKQSPCRYSGSAYQGNFVIAGHNYRRHFSPLKKIAAGAKVRFTDMDGNVFDYQVEATEILQAWETERMTESSWELTLFTCTYGGGERFTVRCGAR